MKNSLPLKNRIKRKLVTEYRRISSPLRVLPSFIIFGAPRCGTTSLYNYLIEHPSIEPALSKEVGFFELNYNKGINWYKLYFPTFFNKYRIEKKFRKYFMTGEATSNYIHHPLVPTRIKKEIPNVKLIALLRNPVDRAFSQFFKQIKQRREDLSFEDAIKKEQDRIKGEIKKMSKNLDYYSLNYHNYSYLTAGIYIDRIKNWFEVFPKEQILIIKSENFYEKPDQIYNEILKFLGLPEWNLSQYQRYNFFEDQPKIKVSTRKELDEFYKPHNKKLYDFLGKDFGW